MQIAIVSLSALMLGAAAPDTPSPPVSATNTNVGDPNEKICETIKPIGSRPRDQALLRNACGMGRSEAAGEAGARERAEKSLRAPGRLPLTEEAA